MTEAKSPREIADVADEAATSIICSAIDHGYEIHGRKFVKQIAASIIQQALLSYDAERERLLDDLCEVIATYGRCTIPALRLEELFRITEARHKSRLSSRPATEGKGED